MTSSADDCADEISDPWDYVSGRFLTDLFAVLERQGIQVTQMLGDLPIPHVDGRVATGRVEWADFVELLRRLEHAVGGATALESCGANIDQMKYAAALRGLAGLTASPHSLYRAATGWALRRALPGIETRVVSVAENRIDIHARLRGGIRPCPQIFHIAAGSARALPRILGLSDAVVDATVGPTEARYRLTLPPSPTLFARIRRFVRAIWSAGSVLHVLEAQQLELHSEHDALRKAHADLAESEKRYRAFSDATVDVLCELDTRGRVVFVSASIEELLGYTPEQVTGSHFRLWVPSEFHDVADTSFEALCKQTTGGAFSRKLVALHSANGRKVVAELSIRCFDNSHGERRLACVVRDLTDASTDAKNRKDSTDGTQSPTSVAAAMPLDRIRRALEEQPRRGAAGPGGDSAQTLPRRGPILERSLEILIAALETHSRESKESDETALIRASEAMTRIVESALVAAEGDTLARQWIETRKLLEDVRLEAAADPGQKRVTIRNQTEAIPAEIFACRDLMITGISSLIDAARKEAPESIQIELRVALGPNLENDMASIDFSVETIPGQLPGSRTLGRADSAANVSTATRSERIDSSDHGAQAEAIALSEAIASDVARTQGGELVIERHEGGQSIRRLRIPNPSD